MTDIHHNSVPSNLTSPTYSFKVGSRVQVENLKDGKPGEYHACQGTITRIFVHEGQKAALVRFSTGVEKKLFLTKLIPAKNTPDAVRPPAAPPTPAPKRPVWAAANTIMVRGDQLQPKDLVYFSQVANPRRLGRWINDFTWTGVTLTVQNGFEHPIPGSIAINPAHWYVVERK